MAARWMVAGICLASLINMPSTASGLAHDSTQVFMTGKILDTPCTIDSDSREQTIDMGVVSVSQMVRQGRGHKVPFRIHLMDCSLSRNDSRQPDWQSFIVTFNGVVDAGNFAVTGGGEGVALQIADAEGNIARPGVGLPAAPLHGGEQMLDYTLQLVRDEHPVREGSYSSVIHFQLNYF